MGSQVAGGVWGGVEEVWTWSDLFLFYHKIVLA